METLKMSEWRQPLAHTLIRYSWSVHLVFPAASQLHCTALAIKLPGQSQQPVRVWLSGTLRRWFTDIESSTFTNTVHWNLLLTVKTGWKRTMSSCNCRKHIHLLSTYLCVYLEHASCACCQKRFLFKCSCTAVLVAKRCFKLNAKVCMVTFL